MIMTSYYVKMYRGISCQIAAKKRKKERKKKKKKKLKKNIILSKFYILWTYWWGGKTSNRLICRLWIQINFVITLTHHTKTIPKPIKRINSWSYCHSHSAFSNIPTDFFLFKRACVLSMRINQFSINAVFKTGEPKLSILDNVDITHRIVEYTQPIDLLFKSANLVRVPRGDRIKLCCWIANQLI